MIDSTDEDVIGLTDEGVDLNSQDSVEAPVSENVTGQKTGFSTSKMLMIFFIILLLMCGIVLAICGANGLFNRNPQVLKTSKVKELEDLTPNYAEDDDVPVIEEDGNNAAKNFLEIEPFEPPRNKISRIHPDMTFVSKVVDVVIAGIFIFFMFLSLKALLNASGFMGKFLYLLTWLPGLWRNKMQNRFKLSSRTAGILTFLQMMLVEFLVKLWSLYNPYYALLYSTPIWASHIISSSIFWLLPNRAKSNPITIIATILFMILALPDIVSWMSLPETIAGYVNRAELTSMKSEIVDFDFSKFWGDNCEKKNFCKVSKPIAEKFVADFKKSKDLESRCKDLYGPPNEINESMQSVCESFNPFSFKKLKQSLNAPPKSTDVKTCKKFFKEHFKKVHPDKFRSPEQKETAQFLFKKIKEYESERCQGPSGKQGQSGAASVVEFQKRLLKNE